MRWSLVVLGFMLAATVVVPTLMPGDLIVGLGIGSVAIGFAFKDILQKKVIYPDDIAISPDLKMLLSEFLN